MATEIETQAVVPEPQEEVDSARRDDSLDQEDKGNRSRLFRRKKTPKKDEKKSRKPPGRSGVVKRADPSAEYFLQVAK